MDNEYTENKIDSTMKDQYLTFYIDGDVYGIEIEYVKEIMKMSTIAPIPEMPHFVEGIFSLRGELVGVLDVRKRFNKPSKEHDEETCIIVVIYDEFTLGLIVDAVDETAIIPENKISPPPNVRLSYANQFIRNVGQVGNDIKLLLDLESFLAYD